LKIYSVAVLVVAYYPLEPNQMIVRYYLAFTKAKPQDIQFYSSYEIKMQNHEIMGSCPISLAQDMPIYQKPHEQVVPLTPVVEVPIPGG
tara:strand:- start:20 stop:286 length:267 start_codon:yes stop_codon:yes gene_type:complete